MSDVGLHRHLLGRQGSRLELNTPALVIDRDALDRNIEAMAAFARAHGIHLRPHAKTHKSVDIGLLQLAAGATGMCCAKLGEAEALAGGGVEDILITSPVVTSQAIRRLVALHQRMRALRVTVDHPRNVADLAAALREAKHALPVLVDVDPGIHRTGVNSAEAAVDLARAITQAPALRFVGIQFYCGAQQHIGDYRERRSAISERTAYLSHVIEALRSAGMTPEIVTGGGTGTHQIDAELGVLNELQVGSYVFMDRQYQDCGFAAGSTPFEPALFIDTRVISANTGGMATVDAGFKAMATDAGAPAIVTGAPGDSMFAFMGDEHGALISAGHSFNLGDLITLAPPHCDPTVNLYDDYHVVRDGTLIDIWPVSARGRSR